MDYTVTYLSTIIGTPKENQVASQILLDHGIEGDFSDATIDINLCRTPRHVGWHKVQITARVESGKYKGHIAFLDGLSHSPELEIGFGEVTYEG